MPKRHAQAHQTNANAYHDLLVVGRLGKLVLQELVRGDAAPSRGQLERRNFGFFVPLLVGKLVPVAPVQQPLRHVALPNLWVAQWGLASQRKPISARGCS
jgi:hypothetical protein